MSDAEAADAVVSDEEREDTEEDQGEPAVQRLPATLRASNSQSLIFALSSPTPSSRSSTFGEGARSAVVDDDYRCVAVTHEPCIAYYHRLVASGHGSTCHSDGLAADPG
jgi:hypothetical protein